MKSRYLDSLSEKRLLHHKPKRVAQCAKADLFYRSEPKKHYYTIDVLSIVTPVGPLDKIVTKPCFVCGDWGHNWYNCGELNGVII